MSAHRLPCKGCDLHTSCHAPGAHSVSDSGLVALLLAAAADVNAARTTGWAPLHTAASNVHLGTAQVLLAAGADVNVADTTGRTPLHVAASHGRREVAVLLLRRGADPQLRDASKQTDLYSAATCRVWSQSCSAAAAGGMGSTPCPSC
jgi:ankyrin repeat protein